MKTIFTATRFQRFRAQLLGVALAVLAPLTHAVVWPSGWAVCPGWDQPTEANDQPHRYEIFASPHTHHWSPSEEHEPVRAISVNRLLPNSRFCGVSLFSNSFGQPSAYAFTGKLWPNPIDALPNVYVSLSGGIMYGYVGRFKNKVPLNVGGFSPVIIPAVGYRLNDRAALEMQLLGTAAVMFGVTMRY